MTLPYQIASTNPVSLSVHLDLLAAKGASTYTGDHLGSLLSILEVCFLTFPHGGSTGPEFCFS